ncbi:MAG: transcription termination/antitermination protein NusG [Mycoplasmataceae bacterium]|nr:transcription termination/antitermination protein NusG [Mycoplasmataceae bacterium]
MENNNKKWYMITTISGREERVIESLRNRVESESIQYLFEDFKVMLVPHLTPKELEKYLAGEEYKIKMKSLFPGYIFIKMDMTNEAWFLVRNTQYVTGLVGSSGHRAKPTPVSPLEMRKMEKQVKRIAADFADGKGITPFKADIIVEVLDGPTKGQIGPILETDDQRQVAVVELIMFERKTPTEIEYKNLRIK